jgi:hypothetical protein
MIKNRLNKIEKMLKPDMRNIHLMAFEYPNKPEENTYSTWDGVPGSGWKKVTKEEWEAMAQRVSEVNVIKFMRASEGNIIKFIDDIAGCENEAKE